MKIFEYLMFFVLFASMLGMFTTIGIFSASASAGSDIAWSASPVELIGLTGWSGIGAIGLGALSMVVLARAGVNPFLAMAYGVVAGLFVGNFMTVFKVMYAIANGFGEYSIIFLGITSIILTVFSYSVIWGMIQMATGGGRGHGV